MYCPDLTFIEKKTDYGKIKKIKPANSSFTFKTNKIWKFLEYCPLITFLIYNSFML